MIELSIRGRKIEVLNEDGFEIWSNILIEETFHDQEGSWVGIRKSLIEVALKRKVIVLHIKTLDTKLNLSIPPEEFVGPKSKTMPMPSKYHGTYLLCLYPVSREVLKINQKKLESSKNK